MLLGNAVTLALACHCFDADDPPPSGDLPKPSHKQEWKHMLSVFIYLTDELLSVRLGIDPMLPNKQRQLAERYHRRYMD